MILHYDNEIIEVMPIPNTSNYYADYLGNIYSSYKNKPVRKIKPILHNTGYFIISLYSKDGRMKQARNHRLVAEAWLPNKDKKTVVNHINEDKTDNKVSNLEWATIKENNWHSKKLLYDPRKDAPNSHGKLTEEDILDIRMFFERGINTIDIARVYKIARSTVYQIINKTIYNWI